MVVFPKRRQANGKAQDEDDEGRREWGPEPDRWLGGQGWQGDRGEGQAVADQATASGGVGGADRGSGPSGDESVFQQGPAENARHSGGRQSGDQEEDKGTER